ncbi:MAG: ABC transporter transmembrane domain-containing protein, partial [Actinomycetota bacterium]|nr:ABC transporter transmembrane domain-containing protein [Actinomycetota bacterium]
MLRTVDVRRGEITGLILLAVMFALFEGIGLSLLLPILQFAEGGQQAILESSDIVWTSIARFMDVFGLPLSLPVLLVMAFIPILFRQAIFYVNVWYGAAVSSRITVRMRMQALDDILNADPEFFTRYSVGQVVGVVVNQTAVAGQAILAVMKQLSIALLMLLYVAILVLISAPLTLVALVFALTVSFVVRASIVRIREFGLESARVSQTLMGKVVERFSLIRLIKLRDQKTQESQHIRDYSEEMRAISIRQARLGASIEVTADPLLMLSVFITLYVGISVLDMTLAQLGLLLFVLNRLNAKVKEFNTGRQRISRNMAGLILVNEMTQDAIASNSIRRGPVPFSGLKEALVFDDVHFEYPDSATTESTTESSS